MRIIHAMAVALLLAGGSLFALPGFIADLYPAQNALNVPADIELRIAFAKPLDPASVSDSSIYIYSDITGLHKWEWELEENGTELTLRPKHWWGVGDVPFNAGERVSTTLTTRLRYMNGEPFEGFTWFYTVAVRQNYGGHFHPLAVFGAGLLERFYIADFNGDRAPDLAAHDTFRDQVAVFLNDGKGKFIFSHWNPGWGASGCVQSLDYDWNGGIDLAIGRRIVQFNDGKGNFVGQEIMPAWAEASRLYDFNNDGLFDIVTNLPHLKSGIKIAFSTENEAFSDTQTVAVPFVPFYTRQIELYDLNNDGKRDIVATGPSEQDRSFCGFATIMIKDSVPLETLQVENSGVFAEVVYANDFNGDHNIDYAFIGGNINPFVPYDMTYLNDGTGYLNPQGVYVDTMKAYLGGAGGDIDGDGDIDFFMKSSYYYSVMPELIRSRYTLAINRSDGVFDILQERKLPFDSTAAGYGYQARLIDLDLDGDLDIMIQSPKGFMVIANEEYRTHVQGQLSPFTQKAAPQIAVFPNPFNSTTEISFSGSVEEVHIYDVLGRLVRSWDGVELPPGTTNLKWDGMDENGQLAPSGVYLIQLIAHEKIAVKKAALLR